MEEILKVELLTKRYDSVLAVDNISFSVNKGDWDKSQGFEKDNDFNRKWLSVCREKLKENGTIWISGTYHNIFSVAQMLNELNFRILNCITWAKTNPPRIKKFLIITIMI